MSTTSLTGHIFDTLSRINCDAHVEKKNNLSYIAWTFAYKTLMEHYPDNTINFVEEWLDNGTVMVHCDLTINVGDQSANRKGWLPVLNYKNNAIVNPDAMQINTTRMRCLTKTLALFGLGLNVYAGESFPSESESQQGVQEPKPVSKISAKQLKLMSEAIQHSGADINKLMSYYKINNLQDLSADLFDQVMHFLNKMIANNAATEQQ